MVMRRQEPVASPHRVVRRLALLAFCFSLAASCAEKHSLSGIAETGIETPRAGTEGTGWGIYAGLGSWVDIYDFSAWADPEGTVAAMAEHGVRTLYLETSNYKRHKPFVFREGVERFIDASHAAGIAVVAWYLPGFAHVDRDFTRTMKAVDLITPGGQRFDSFALDIESPLVKPASLRTERLLDLSGRIREAVGESYPLGAIIPSPRGMQVNPDYWPGFPYLELAATYDVMVPMTYFTWRVSGLDGAHHYTTLVTQIIRNETGDPQVPIHVIGGISDEATAEETRGFVRAIRERGVIGASYYGFPGTTDGQWAELSRIPVNPVQSPAMPVPIGVLDPLGNLPDGDGTHPKEVFFSASGRAGSWRLTFEVYDAQPGEISLWVNWNRIGTIKSTEVGTWSELRSRTIADQFLLDGDTNVVAFTARGEHPAWSVWGVRSVALAAE
jgi:hypothetical protein